MEKTVEVSVRKCQVVHDSNPDQLLGAGSVRGSLIPHHIYC